VEPIAAGKAGDRPEPALVECHSGAEYADRPLAFTWQGQRLEIADILGQWRTPNEKGFRIRTTDGQAFELTYREIPDDWQVRSY
jgi:hypothetical protein